MRGATRGRNGTRRTEADKGTDSEADADANADAEAEADKEAALAVRPRGGPGLAQWAQGGPGGIIPAAVRPVPPHEGCPCSSR